VSRFLYITQGLFRPQETDGTVVLWAKEILAFLLIVMFFWILSMLVGSILTKWGKRLALFTETDLDDRLLQRVVPHVSRLLLMSGVYLVVRSLPLHAKLVQLFSGVLFVILIIILFNLVDYINIFF